MESVFSLSQLPLVLVRLIFSLLLSGCWWWQFVCRLQDGFGIFAKQVETAQFFVTLRLPLDWFQQFYDPRRGRRQLAKGLWDQRVFFIARANVIDVGNRLVKNSRNVADEFGTRSFR